MKKILLTALFMGVFGFINAQNISMDLYRLERNGDNFILQGKFEDAYKTYQPYTKLTGARYSRIDNKINSSNKIGVLFLDAERLFKDKSFVKAIEKYKQCRDLFPELKIGKIDKRIEESIREIEQSKLIDKIDQKDKIILAYSYTFLGEDAIYEGDFEKAQTLFRKANKLVGNNNRDVQNRSSKGQDISSQLIILRQDYEKENDDSQRLNILKRYKEFSEKFNVKPFENAISLLELSSVNKGNFVVTNNTQKNEVTLEILSKTCNLKALIAFIEQIPNRRVSNDNDSLLLKLNNISNQILQINNIKTGDPSQRHKFVEGGYKTIIEETLLIPIIGNNLSICFRNDYYKYLIDYSKEIVSQRLSLENAQNLAIEAVEVATTDEEKEIARTLIKQINSAIGCSETLKNFSIRLSAIKVDVENCKFENAQKQINDAKEAGKGCETSDEIVKLNNLEDQLNNWITNEKEVNVLKREAAQSLINFNCDRASENFEKINEIALCNRVEIGRLYLQNKEDCQECIRVKNYMNYSENVRNLISYRKLDEAREIIKKVENYSKTEVEKKQISSLYYQIDQKQEEIKAEKKKEKKEYNNKFDKFRILELYGSPFTILSTVVVNGNETIKTSSLVNYEVGLNYRFFNRGNPLGGIIGLHYSKNKFTTIDSKTSNNIEKFDIDFLTADLMGTFELSPNTNNRSYFGLGLGYVHPIKVIYQNLKTNYNYTSEQFKTNTFINGQPYFKCALGFERRRRNRGISCELYCKYLFSQKVDNVDVSLFKSNINSPWLSKSSNTYETKYLTLGLGLTFHLW